MSSPVKEAMERICNPARWSTQGDRAEALLAELVAAEQRGFDRAHSGLTVDGTALFAHPTTDCTHLGVMEGWWARIATQLGLDPSQGVTGPQVEAALDELLKDRERLRWVRAWVGSGARIAEPSR